MCAGVCPTVEINRPQSGTVGESTGRELGYFRCNRLARNVRYPKATGIA